MTDDLDTVDMLPVMAAPGAAEARPARSAVYVDARFRVSPGLIVAIFVLSGAAGLIYEVVWSRQLVIVFGNTTQAVSTILTGFFGGMALGAWAGGRIADRVRSPLRMYGLLEIGVAAVAIATPVTFHLLHEAYRGIYPQLVATPGALGLVRFGLAILALAPATILMGATFPCLTRYLAKSEGGLAGAFGRLYAANLIGAIIGTAIAGLILIELLGLTGTLVVGAVCSSLAGVVALALSRSRRDPLEADATAARERADAAAAEAPAVVAPTFRVHAARPRLALVIAFTSGLTSLAYQVLWVRLVSEGTGNATYVFTLILVLFLGGLAYGALLVASRRFSRRDPLAVVALCQVLVGALALIGLLVFTLVPGLQWVFSALIVVLPPAIVLGIAFPASSALLDDRDGRTGGETGALLAVNTVGAIVGTFVVPFFLIPAVGSPTAVALVAIGNALLGGYLATQVRPGPWPRIVPVASALVVVAIVGSLAAHLVEDPTVTRLKAVSGTLFEAREDEIAPAAAGKIGDREQLWVNGTSMTALTVDAKLMPVLSLMLRPNSERALVIAFGMGSAYRAALIAGLTTDAVELVPSVPALFGWFYPDADAVKADPNGKIIVADGRNHVELTDATYDIVVVDPPPPIESAGVSVISSLEFYQAARSRLTAGGVMMQWLPFGETVDEFRAHLRTYRSVFPNVLVAIGPGHQGTYLFGSDSPLAFDPATIDAVLARPGVVEDMSSAFDSPTDSPAEWAKLIPSYIWLAGDGVAAFAGTGPLITDDHPMPEYYALRHAFGARSPYLAGPDDLPDPALGP